MVWQPVVKLEPRCERPFSGSSALQKLERSPIFLRFCASICRKIARSRQRLTFTTGCWVPGAGIVFEVGFLEASPKLDRAPR